MNGMKKTVAFGMALALSATLLACGNQNQDPEQNTTAAGGTTAVTETPGTSGTTETTQPQKETEKGGAYQKSDLLPGIYNVPLEDIYVDVPNYQAIEEGYTQLYIVHESRYVAFTSELNTTSTEIMDAHDKVTKKFVQNMGNYEGGVNSVNPTKSEVINVNGMEVYSFEGTINYGVDPIHDGYAKGYSFIMDGIPCQIIGSVIDDSQSQELIDEINEVVDAMIKTVRSEM